MVWFPDPEAVVIGWLEPRLGVRCVSELPGEVQDQLPIIRIYRVSGAENDPKLDRPILDVDVFAANMPAANALAEQTREQVRFHLPGTTTGGAVVTFAWTIIGPRWLPDSNLQLRRVSASYLLALHREVASAS